jgi:DNA polymerase III subunit beta
MKFTVQQKDLLKLLQVAGNGVPRKTTLPILSNFLIEARPNGIRVAATDLEISISTSLEVTVEDPGQVAVNARRLEEVVRELPKDAVAVSLADGKFRMECQRSKTDLFPMAAEDFPTLGQERASFSVSIPAKTFQKLVEMSVYSVSTDETRPALGGILVQVADKEIRFVATDGHRLAKAFAPGAFPVEKKEPREAIVPPKALVPVAAWAVESGSDVEMEISASTATFKVGATTLSTRLLQGPFPNFEQVIPKDNKKLMVVNREAFVAALRRVSKLSDTASHQVRMSLRKNRAHLSVSTADVGEAKDDLEAKYGDDDLEIGYNAVYLLDILKSMDAENVQFALNTPVSAGVVTPLDSKSDAQALCLIMPLRLQD